MFLFKRFLMINIKNIIGPADKNLDRELSYQSKFASVFYWAQAAKRQLDALLTIPDQIIVQNRYKPPILW